MLPNIGIVGRKRSGKDTLARILVTNHGYAREALADPLRMIALQLNPLVTLDGERLSDVVAGAGWESAKDDNPEVRRTLQRLGTEVIRDHFGPDTWVNLLKRRMDHYNGRGIPVAVPDVRFPNEAAGLRQSGALLIRVTRTDTATIADEHVSESHVDTIPVDVELPNDASITALSDRVNTIIAHYRKDTR